LAISQFDAEEIPPDADEEAVSGGRIQLGNRGENSGDFGSRAAVEAAAGRSGEAEDWTGRLRIRIPVELVTFTGG